MSGTRAAQALGAALLLAATASSADEPAEWPYFGGTSGGTRYSAAKQIDRDNVGEQIGRAHV